MTTAPPPPSNEGPGRDPNEPFGEGQQGYGTDGSFSEGKQEYGLGQQQEYGQGQPYEPGQQQEYGQGQPYAQGQPGYGSADAGPAAQPQHQWGGAPQQAGTAEPYGQQPYGAQPGAPAYAAPGAPVGKPRNGFGVAALVLGIISFLMSWIPLIGFPTGLLGVIFGFLGLGRAKNGLATNRTVALIGLILAAIGFIFSIGWGIFSGIMAVNDMNNALG